MSKMKPGDTAAPEECDDVDFDRRPVLATWRDPASCRSERDSVGRITVFLASSYCSAAQLHSTAQSFTVSANFPLPTLTKRT